MPDKVRIELADTLTLAAEQMRYADALYNSMIDSLGQADRRCPKVLQAESLARLGRYHAEEWLARFEEDKERVWEPEETGEAE